MNSEKISFDVFPQSANEALAMLYLQNQDLSGKTPEEILRSYYDALNKIKAERKLMMEEERKAKGMY